MQHEVDDVDDHVRFVEFDPTAKPNRASPIIATPFVWVPPERLPRRRFIYGSHYIRRFLSVDVAAGGVGKSSHAIVELLAIITGRPLLGITPAETGRVWYFNGEDPAEEITRRVIAAALHHGIAPAEIEGRLFIDSGRDKTIVIAEQTRDGTTILRPIVDGLIEEIRRREVIVFRADPFVSTHRVSENDNAAISQVAKEWAGVADAADCATALTHHMRKNGGGGATASIDDGRGGSSLNDAARSVRAMSRMTEDEAAKAGVANPRLYFRVDGGKTSMGPPAEKVTWCKLDSCILPNGPDGTPGDSVGVAVPWAWPDAFAGITKAQTREVQDAIRSATEAWRKNPRADRWVGFEVGRVLGISATTKEGRARLRAIVDQWLETGVLVQMSQRDDKGHDRPVVLSGETLQ